MHEALSARDLRALFDLHGELGEVAANAPSDALDHLMARLPGLLGGDPVVWWTVTDDTQTKLLATRTAGLDSSALRVWEKSYLLEGTYAEHPLWPSIMARSPLQTLRRRDAVNDSTWYRSPHIAEYTRELGYDDVVASRRKVDSIAGKAGHALLAVSRPWGARPFSKREATLLHTMQGRLGWLHRKAMLKGRSAQRDALRDALPQRFRPVLKLLLEGRSEKEIAFGLGLSPRTVHKYVEEIYEAFEVQSRPQLMALWIDRDAME